jgi:hypothetical protein
MSIVNSREMLVDATRKGYAVGDPECEKGELRSGGEGLDHDGVLTVDQIVDYFSTKKNEIKESYGKNLAGKAV